MMRDSGRFFVLERRRYIFGLVSDFVYSVGIRYSCPGTISKTRELYLLFR